MINLLKLLRRGDKALILHLFAGSERGGVIVINIMVAVDDEHLCARILFKLLKLCRNALVRFCLAVFRQVARNEDIFQPFILHVLCHRGKGCVYEPAGLRELFALDPAKLVERLPTLLIAIRWHE